MNSGEREGARRENGAEGGNECSQPGPIAFGAGEGDGHMEGQNYFQPICSTTWNRGESMRNQKEHLRTIRNATKVWVCKESGIRLRMESERLCTRMHCDRYVTEHHSVRTILQKRQRMDFGKRGRTVYHRAVGKFRTVLRMRRTGGET